MNSWKQTLIKPETTIRKALEVIDGGGLQIALVCDAAQRLIGTVTDGDVRRGILKGIALDDPVKKVMRDNPTAAAESQTKQVILAMMKSKHLHQIPVLDKEGKVIDLQILDELLQTTIRDNWVVLMAGGLGSRLMPLTEQLPKPLIAVGEKPILETILENFIEYGFKKFFIAVNYKDELIKEYFKDGSKWGAEIRYICEDKKMGTAGALSLLPEIPKLPLIVMNGDLLTKINFSQLLSFHHEHELTATMCVREYDFQVPYGVVKISGHTIDQIDEKPIQRFFVNAGIYVLEPETLKHIPLDAALDMPQLFDSLMKCGNKTAAFPIREYWIDIGQLKDLERANGDFAKIFR